VTDLEKVSAELQRYEHALLIFTARERNGVVELMIQVKHMPSEFHPYCAPVHPRDIAHAQFAWSFQRYLYDCMHDYLVALFVRTPQARGILP
jgi:hypothetical protein